LSGYIDSEVKIGLFYNNVLVSLMIFEKINNKFMNESYEILRFCNKLNISVIGGSGKLIKYFINKYKPKEIISYDDRSWSNGNLHKKLGFDLIHKTKPSCYFIIGDKKIHSGIFVDNQSTVLDEIKNEKEPFKIYDSGKLKFLLKC
jgi:hypothetical protein